MKDWLKFIIAAAAGLAISMFLPESAFFTKFIAGAFEIVLRIGLYMLVPFILISFSAGISSLRRQRQGFASILYALLWSLVTTVACTLVSGITAWQIVPAGLGEVVSSGAALTVTELPAVSIILQDLLQPDFLSATVPDASLFLIPGVILFSLLFGAVLKPDEDYIRPAFAVMNSFSEVFYRFARIITQLLALGVVFVSSYWFTGLLAVIDLDAVKGFLLLFGIVFAALVFLIIPLLLVLIGHERRPYQWLIGVLGPVLIAWFSGSSTVAITPLLSHTRNNLGAAKRVSSTAIPVIAMVGRSGSAAIAALTTISLYSTVFNIPLTFKAFLLVIAFSTLLSFTLSTVTGGAGILMIVAGTGIALGFGNQFTASLVLLVPVMPLLGSAAACLDTLVTGVGAGAVSNRLQANITVRVRDYI